MSKKRNLFLKIIGISGIVFAGMECLNRLLFHLAVKDAETSEQDHMHEWRNGSFYFEKRENQDKEGLNSHPILILHDLYPDQSSHSCSHLADQLAEKRTVYLMDLLGCGKSDKPAVTYINYLYVQQIMEMIDAVIKEPVHLVAYRRSAVIGVAAAHYQPEKIVQLTLIDPMKESGKKMPDRKSKMIKKLVELPVIGPFLYNIEFKMNQYAHLGGMNARYLFASILGNYTNWDTNWMLKDMKTPIHVIVTEEYDNMDSEEENA